MSDLSDSPRPASDRTGLALRIGLGAAFVHVFATMFWNGWPADLSAVYFAAKSVATGNPGAIYAAPPDFFSPGTPAPWVALAEGTGHGDKVILPYLYPPLWAHLLAPLTEVVPPMAFFNTVLILHLAMLAAMPWIGWQIARPAGLALRHWLPIGFLLLLTSAPSLGAIIQNQPQIAVTFLVLLAALAARRDRPVSAGLLLALAAALKLQPALFGLVFLLTRNWRAAGAMACAGGALLSLSLLLGGLDAHRDMLARLAEIDAMVVYTKVNYALESLLYQISQVLQGTPLPDGRAMAYPILDAPSWVQTVPKLLFAAGLLSLVLRARRFTGPRLWLALALLGALFGPLSWGHYFVLPTMLLPALFEDGARRTDRLWLAAFAILFSFPLYSALIPFNEPLMVSQIPPLLMLLGLTLHVLLPARAGSRAASPR
ncbi:glycosyltransferase 87 family protein [Celeribacter indicus]|uniref:DUF2029 domain-containing protein n=1 Tax=Celeribacter indicus TaxID=1208324 RepID=A0A0B5DY08_9RHOB|nr:glycosyltransferase 87 family protein [Celeribacter indicus]AJE48323.1 hypothetical protein P73_3608 [Celeribacter indicus]SDW72785.1 Protein of unknown function [Celeribacter indicus]